MLGKYKISSQYSKTNNTITTPHFVDKRLNRTDLKSPTNKKYSTDFVTDLANKISNTDENDFVNF